MMGQVFGFAGSEVICDSHGTTVVQQKLHEMGTNKSTTNGYNVIHVKLECSQRKRGVKKTGRDVGSLRAEFCPCSVESQHLSSREHCSHTPYVSPGSRVQTAATARQACLASRKFRSTEIVNVKYLP